MTRFSKACNEFVVRVAHLHKQDNRLSYHCMTVRLCSK